MNNNRRSLPTNLQDIIVRDDDIDLDSSIQNLDKKMEGHSEVLRIILDTVCQQHSHVAAKLNDMQNNFEERMKNAQTNLEASMETIENNLEELLNIARDDSIDFNSSVQNLSRSTLWLNPAESSRRSSRSSTRSI